MEWMFWGLPGLAALFAVASLMTPTTVQYAETIEIESPIDVVFDHVRFQERLMLWSAWPSETKSTCAVAGTDGAVGAQTVFVSKGKRFGHQEIVEITEGRDITFRLVSAGPPQKPEIAFRFNALSSKRTLVTLRFRNEIARPFNLLLRLFGIVRWTRSMHRKDLVGLKRFSEPPHLTYTGEKVTWPARSAA